MRPALLFVLTLFGWAVTARAESPSLTILPGDFILTGPAARQTLLVQETRDGTLLGQETRDGKLLGQLAAKDVTLTSSDDKVVKIDAGAAVPVANGSATIT